ncbi:putative lipoprotein [Treponema primitia ZAS-2]|uniref:Putative lipoprotein n=1 Tax=Treponema primitia (strain ATCC BAA-887 / DSM 12427 / ZAS-2) TaxID=545694 RepID=F5YQU6_TREPZ|nr:Ig-like domain-containing protein [Treponema primitia]AEF86707.1 putative lipoprotein [Treponema primitia ZAS-2]
MKKKRILEAKNAFLPALGLLVLGGLLVLAGCDSSTNPTPTPLIGFYTVTVVQSTGGTISASPNTAVAAGTTVTVTVTPDTEYVFTEGSLAYNGIPIAAGVYTFPMPAANVTVTGSFTHTYTITPSAGIQHGSISADSPAKVGDTVTITVTPDPGYVLGTLTYNDGTDHTITGTSFTMPAANVTITGTFISDGTPLFAVTIASGITNGTITASHSTGVAATTTVTVTAAPATGYELTSLVYNDGTDHAITGTSFTMPAANVTITGTFSLSSETNHSVTVASGITNGTISASPFQDVAAGTTVTVTVTPATKYELTPGSLKYNDGTDHTITGNSFTMPAANVTITGAFRLISGTNTYSVILLQVTGGTISASPNTAVTEGTSVTVTANPYSGYELKSGTLKYNNGTTATLITDNSFTMPAADVTITGEFSLIPIPVQSISLPANIELIPTGTLQLNAIVSPDTATNKTLTWTSSDSSKATVTTNGLVKGVSVGTAIITATAADGSGKKAECTVTVKDGKQLSFTFEGFNNQTIDLTKSTNNDISLSNTSQSPLQITLVGDWNSIGWYVDGEQRGSGSSSFVFDLYNSAVGEHTVTVVVYKGIVPYSKELKFRVVK